MFKIAFVKKSAAVVLVYLLTITAGAGMLQASNTPAGFEIIPKPLSMAVKSGTFTLDLSTIIVVPEGSNELKEIGRSLNVEIRKITGYELEVQTARKNSPSSNIIILTQNARASDLGKEGYTLDVTAERIEIAAPEPAGLFWATQTVRQILLSSSRDNTSAGKIPCVSIVDKPAFDWRGLQLDCSRNFMSMDFVKRYIDLLAYHKLNILHWHIIDDQGWRLESKIYPKLTEKGAWRPLREFGRGGYYTQDEAREIVEYASKRYITVVPEIEMPGHATAAIAAYPELSCDGKQIEVETVHGIHKNLFCVGKESTFTFLENILKETCEIFPSKYIHIGGDEAVKDRWEACPHCQKRIKDLGIKDENELQGYFTRRIDKFMRKQGRVIIGWDEILEGHPSKTAIVQSWRGEEGAIEGSKAGHQVISTPFNYVYFDFPNEEEGVNDTGWLRLTNLEQTYSFNPVPEVLTEEEAKFILGGEATLFSERLPQPEIDNNIFPRLTAFSETVWTPADMKDWDDFQARMNLHFGYFDVMGVDYFKRVTSIGMWGAGQVTADSKTIDWDITKHITEPGHKRVNFRHDEGESNIVVDWAALLEDGVEIGRDAHEGLTGKQVKANAYRFAVHAVKPGAKYTLRAKIRTDSGADSKGSVVLRNFGAWE